jgi:dTDP-4-amino-4,6-dideoxygalactose transaminase
VPAIDEREQSAVAAVMASGWLTTGPRAEMFEELVRDLVGVEAAFATSSCTAALHLALLACGIGPGDEVLIPDITFCAAANVVMRVGATPVLVDVDLRNCNLDVEHAASLITTRTKAIMPVHYGGEPADMDTIRQMARRHDLLIIEDAAHAIGSYCADGKHVGAHSDLTAFSFYANKVITTGEGGMLVGRADLIGRARTLGRHGIDKPIWDRSGNRAGPAYDVVAPGLKYNMSDIAAAIGVVQFDKLESLIEGRRAIAAYYDSRLKGSDMIGLLESDPSARSARHLYAIRIIGEGLSDSRRRDLVQVCLRARNVDTSVHFIPLHRLTCFRGIEDTQLPNASVIGSQILSLPCYPGMTEAQCASTVRFLLEAVSAP